MRISDWSSDVCSSDLHMVALAALMPIVAGVGGNAGTQTLAVPVRALAMNQLTDSHSWRAVWREMKIALLHVGTIALNAGVPTAPWFAYTAPGRLTAAPRVVKLFAARATRARLRR